MFTILRVVPGDPAVMMLSGGGEEGEEYTQEALANLRAELGTDRPIYVQYADWVWKMLRLDFGASLFFDNPVSEHIEQRLPVTLQLGLMAAFLAVIVAVPLGVYSALRQDTLADYIARSLAGNPDSPQAVVFLTSIIDEIVGVATDYADYHAISHWNTSALCSAKPGQWLSGQTSRTITILGIAVPNFWVAIMMIFFLVLWFGYLPPLGFVNFWDDPSANLQQLIFPAIALGTSNTAFIARITRSAMLEVLREDYIRTARAKGLREAVVIFRHALRNSLLPVLTVVGHEVGGIISGTVVIEVVFLVPGMGRLLITSIVNRDFAMIQGVVIMIAVFVLSINLIADLLYAWLNPRIRYS